MCGALWLVPQDSLSGRQYFSNAQIRVTQAVILLSREVVTGEKGLSAY